MNKEEIIYIKTNKLRNNPNNPRKNDDAVEVVAKSIERYGFRNPLIVDENNIVWCGNTRLKASRKLGIEECPCIVVKDLTEQQMTELALLDNKTGEVAEWDYEMLQEQLVDLDLDDFDLDWGVLDIDELSDNFQLENKDENEIGQMTFTLHRNQQEIIKEALRMITDEDLSETFGNTNKNGNALYEVVKEWVEQRK